MSHGFSGSALRLLAACRPQALSSGHTRHGEQPPKVDRCLLRTVTSGNLAPKSATYKYAQTADSPARLEGWTDYCNTMSQTAPAAPSSYSSADFLSVFNAALEAYEKTTKNKLLTHPLATQLQSCHSPTDILPVLRDLVQPFDQSRSSNERVR